MAEHEDNKKAHMFELTSTHCIRILWASVASAPTQAWKPDYRSDVLTWNYHNHVVLYPKAIGAEYSSETYAQST